MKKQLPMRQFSVVVWVVPTTLEQRLFGAEPRVEQRIIEGYTLKDAKRRAGIAD